MDKLSKNQAIQGIIDRTKEVRAATGLSQDEMAKRLGVERLTYAKYETRTKLPIELLDKFCSICNVTPAYILTGTTGNELSEIEEKFYKADPNVQKAVATLLGINFSEE